MRGKSFYISRENWYLENVTIDLVADADASVQYDGVLTASTAVTCACLLKSPRGALRASLQS